jgi:competence protein ComEC
MRKILVGILVLLIGGWGWYSFQPHYAQPPSMEAWMLDVGQGESVLVREPTGKKILFDGGPDDSVLEQLGTILPPWDKQIDLVILSHPHSDHIRGLISVLERYTVKEVWSSGTIYDSADYKAWMSQLMLHHLTAKAITAPFTEQFGNIILKTYHPLKDMTGQKPSQAHDGTLSIKLSFGTEDLFLTGDLNEEHEAEMVAQCQPPACDLEAEVLQIPHHGSATGLTPEFLQAVHPQYALIPVGKDNKFNHPRPNIIQELNDAHIPIFRTDLNQQIHLVFTGKTITVTPAVPTH